LLNFSPNTLQEKDTTAVFQSSWAKRIIEELQNQYNGKIENFNPAVFAKKLPDELIDLFASLLLASGEYEDPEFVKKEIESTKRNLAVMQIKEEMEKLAFKIRDLELQGRSEEVVSFEEKLTELSRQLTKLRSESL